MSKCDSSYGAEDSSRFKKIDGFLLRVIRCLFLLFTAMLFQRGAKAGRCVLQVSRAKLFVPALRKFASSADANVLEKPVDPTAPSYLEFHNRISELIHGLNTKAARIRLGAASISL